VELLARGVECVLDAALLRIGVNSACEWRSTDCPLRPKLARPARRV
jgi:hypothetical protein